MKIPLFPFLAGFMLVPCIAHAQIADASAVLAPAPVAEASVSATITLASQYVSRGMRQSWGKPALQAGVDYVHPSGWSVGTWTSTITDRFVEDGTVEWDLYGGYASTAGALGYSAMVYYYLYPGAEISATSTKFNYGELSGGLNYKALYAKYNHTFTRDFFGVTNARGTGYLDVGANLDLGAGYTLNLHAGQGRVAGTGNDYWNWRDIKVGATRTLDGGWTVAAAYTRAKGATDAYDAYSTGIPTSSGKLAFSNPAKGTFVLTIAKTFSR